MGADMIGAYLVTDKDKKLNWDAVDAALAAMSDDDITTGVTDAFGEPEETIEGDRTKAREVFTALYDLIDGDSPDQREMAMFTVRGVWVYYAGGMSGGDSPSDAFDTINRAWYFFDVLAAIGFDG